MGRSPACPPEEKLRIVLEVLAGRITLRQAASAAGVSTTAIGNWKRQFLRAAHEGLAASSSSASDDDLARLRAENKQLAEQVRDAAVLAKVWRMSARAPYENN